MADMTAAMLNYQNPNAAPWWANGGFGGALGAWYTDPNTGQTYQPLNYGANNNAEGGGGVMPQTTGYAAYDMSLPGGQRAEDGQTYDEYGADGKFIANRDFLSTKDDLSELMGYFALAAGGMQFLPGGMFGGPAGGAGAAGTGGSVGSGAGFVGEGALSGVGAWDGALAGAGTGSMGAGAGGLGSLAAGGGGVPANPFVGGAGAAGAAGAGGSSGGISSLFGGSGAAGAAGGGGLLSSLGLGGGGSSNLLGLGATALGGLLGAKGNEASTSSTRAMDPRMDALFYGDLAPKTASTMAGQMSSANTAGNQMLSVGGGLLGQTAPTTATNPYLTSIADDMQRRTQEMLSKNNLAIQGNAVGVGGLGGSRQGVAQGVAAGQAADTLQGQIAGLYGNAYNQDQNRLRQDWTIGAGLQSQGLNTQFQPLRNAADVYTPFTGYGTTTQSPQSGGGAMGAVGGALGAAQLGKNMGWW